MASSIEYHIDYRIAIYSPGGHFAVITPPGSNAVINLGPKQPKSTVVEGAAVCLQRARAIIDALNAQQ